MLSWKKSDRERQILSALSSTWGNLKKKEKLIDADWSLLKMGKNEWRASKRKIPIQFSSYNKQVFFYPHNLIDKLILAFAKIWKLVKKNK